MAPARPRVYRRGRSDAAVSEVISYVFMLALGTIAMTISMGVLSETTEDTESVAAGIQLKQIGTITAEQVELAVRSATTAPDANYSMTFDIPLVAGGYSYDVTVEGVNCHANTDGGTVTVATTDGEINTTVSLTNAARVTVNGQCLLANDLGFDSSTGKVEVRYIAVPTPKIILQTAR